MKKTTGMQLVVTQGSDVVTSRLDQVPVFRYPSQEAVINSLRLGHPAVQVTTEDYPETKMEQMQEFVDLAALPGEEFECTDLKRLREGRLDQSNCIFTVRYKK